jgi:hypothetical protein
VWEKIVSSKTVYYNKRGEKVTINGYKIQLKEYDCSERKIKLHTVITYNSAGKIVNNYSIEEYMQKWEDAVPETVGEMMMEKACELF